MIPITVFTGYLGAGKTTIILNSNTQKTSCPTPTTYTSTIFTSDVGGDSCSRTITISNDNVTDAA
jgi:hypothetical protein